MTKKTLGKNASELFQTVTDKSKQQDVATYSYIEHQESVRLIEIKNIHQGRMQPRRFFDEESIQGLAESIREIGVIQPIVVQLDPIGGYELVAGERRWRAAVKAGLEKIPAIIREYSDQQASLTALIENVQREDLNPIDKAQAFSDLIGIYQFKQHELAEKIGLSRSQIANSLRLLKLDDDVREALLDKKITEGHAKVLAGVSEHEQRRHLKLILKRNLSVRQLEQLIQSNDGHRKNKKNKSTEVDLFGSKITQLIEEFFLAKARFIETGEQKGQITIFFDSYDELQNILNRLGIDTQIL
jgi:ParB family chromosome partitioning protein